MGPPGGPAVLDGVRLRLEAGQVAVLLGGNGAGKTTLLRTAAGLWPPLSGRIRPRRDGFDPRDAGFVLDDPSAQLVAGTVAGEIEFALESLGLSGTEIRERTDRALAGFGLEPLAGRDSRTLSVGELARCVLAAAWAPGPPLLLLDDPFLYLGPAAAEGLWDRVAASVREGMVGGILLATQDGEIAAGADRVGLLDGGRLTAWGPPEDVLSLDLPRAVEPPLGPWLVRELRGRGWRLPGAGFGTARLADRIAAELSE